MRTRVPPIFRIPAWDEPESLKTVMPTMVRAVRSAVLEFSMVAPMTEPAVQAHSEGEAASILASLKRNLLVWMNSLYIPLMFTR